jgi:hypothetical protein
MIKSSSSLIAAAILFASTSGAFAAHGLSYSYETPAQNVARSQWYDRLLETNLAFRHYRMRKECGPIDFTAALKGDCLQSFDTFEPMAAGYR